MLSIDEIEITKTDSSNLTSVDFSNLPFGKVFSDHMFTADYHAGQWQNLKVSPYNPLQFYPAFITLHYGQAIFEGLKAYRNVRNEIVLFRPEENAKRFNKSASRLCMPEIPVELFIEAITKLVSIDEAWVPSLEDGSLYIRPHMFATDQFIGVHPSADYTFCIFTCPSGPYFSKPTKVKIETQYSRACEGGIGYAKAAANYAAALYPTKIAIEEGFDQVIWTDAKEHRYIEEAGTMNVFFRIGNELITPTVGDTILDGITRKSVIQIASELNIPLIERKISVDEVIKAIQTNNLFEAFGTGTAATVSPIAEIGYEGINYKLPEHAEARSYSMQISKRMDRIKSGEESDPYKWIIRV